MVGREWERWWLLGRLREGGSDMGITGVAVLCFGCYKLVFVP